MWLALIKKLFFLPELISDFQIPLHRQQFPKFIYRYLHALYFVIKYKYPARHLKIIGVTGTDGKTTTTNLIYQMLTTAGKKASVVSTIYGKVGDQTFDTGFHVTTPNAWDIQRYLAQAVKAGDEYFVIETSSHGLDQYRLLSCDFVGGVVTNLTKEHLDYHRTIENYLKAKAKLFQLSEIAVLNADDPAFNKFQDHVKGRLVTYALTKAADFNLANFKFETSLIGDFNKQNILAAAALVTNLGVERSIVVKAIKQFKTPAGRMELYPTKKPFKIYIDYAHTPNGVEKAIQALRAVTKKQLIVLIGAEGYRDPGKRGPIAEIAAKLADLVIITAVDPRGQIEQINKTMLDGAIKGGAKLDKSVWVIADRQAAIDFAVNKLAKAGDTVALFGKGAENSMNLDGQSEIAWSEYQAVKQALQSRKS